MPHRPRLPRPIGVLPLLLPVLLSGCWMEPWPTLEDPDAFFLYVGPVGDHGWTKSHDDGRLYLEDEVPGIHTTYEPSVSPADAASVLQSYVDGGSNILFTTSYDFLSPTQTAAANNPDANFMGCSGFVSSPNMGSYFGRMFQVWYLAGMVAGHMAAKGNHRVGVVGPVTIPETIRHLGALTLGIRSVDPTAEVRVEWINAWFDVEAEPEVATALLEWGADVIVNKTDTTIALETVQGWTETDHDVWSIGYDNQDSCEVVGDRCLTAPYWNWGPLYVRIVESMLDGTWDPSEIIWDQIVTDPVKSTVYLADIHSAVETAFAMQVWDELAYISKPENKHFPYVGPLYDNQGNLRLGQGEEMADEDLLRMCWYVEGIVDANGDPAEVPGGCGGDY